MMSTLSITERLRRVATVSDLMLAGSVQAYRPSGREHSTIIHDRIHMDDHLRAA